MFAAGKYDQFATVVGEINRTFVTDSFRTGQGRKLGREDHASDRDTHPGERTGGNRPYFEVLIVEDMTEEQERALREELLRSRCPDDQFVFEILVVPSLDEAVMAARLNFALQAGRQAGWRRLPPVHA
jgi:arginine decarboxylase